MNLTITMAVAAIVLLCIILYLLSKKKTATLPRTLQTLLGFAERNGSHITLHDSMNNLAIGFSEKDNVLYFLKMINEKQVLAHANISEIREPILNKAIRKSNNGVDEAIETISLVFPYKDSTKPVVQFEFYNIAYDRLSVYGEFELAKKWQKFAAEKVKG